MTTDDIMSLCDQVRETAYAIHVYHGNGYLEKVYENALVRFEIQKFIRTQAFHHE